jgi:hypothetical protein
LDFLTTNKTSFHEWGAASLENFIASIIRVHSGNSWFKCAAFEEGLDRIGAERRKTAAGSPKGERSESINKIYRILGIG